MWIFHSTVLDEWTLKVFVIICAEKLNDKSKFGFTNGHGNIGKKKLKSKSTGKTYYSEKQIERHKPNPLGKNKSLIR